jgi:hypothetical protein
MTRPAQAIAAASAVMADRYATAASAAAREATRAATMAGHHGRSQNVTSTFVRRAAKAARTGDAYEQTLQASDAYGQMAGIASTAKYAAAAANATRYAADAAAKAGARRAARRAENAARIATSWADMARHRAESSHFAPYTALKTARYARRAAAAARYAARAAGPLGRCTTSAVGLAAALLPSASRDRYTEEWKSDLCYLSRRQRARFVVGMLGAAFRLAVVLRQPMPRGKR